MIHVRLESETDFAGWWKAARTLIGAAVAPRDVVWSVGGAADLFGAGDPLPDDTPAAQFTVPRGFLRLAETAFLHRDRERFGLLYRLLVRLRAEPGLLSIAMDSDVARLEGMAKSVRRDIHKMRAFVRFRQVEVAGAEWFVAWFEPEHHILETNAPFFQRRFAGMKWSILTPEASAHWDGETLTFGPGGTRAEAPADDAMETLWRDYYASIFNPARLKISAMKSEMPVKYWRNLPEAALIAPLIADAERRAGEMIAHAATPANPRPHRLEKAAPNAAPADDLEVLKAQASGCRACPLWAPATQTVFGEGPADAPVMFVGEQPGDQEDLDGRPFVGPAGRLFDQALQDAGLERARAYVTNAVKHFKFEPRGRRRLHQSPNPAEIRACNTWLAREIALVRPRLVVALGASAAQAVSGRAVRVGESRGRIMPLEERDALVSVHPSYLLRLPDAETRAREYDCFVADLRLAAPYLAG